MMELGFSEMQDQALEPWKTKVEPELIKLTAKRGAYLRRAGSQTMLIISVVVAIVVSAFYILPIEYVFIVAVICGCVGFVLSEKCWHTHIDYNSSIKQMVVGEVASTFGFRYDALDPDVFVEGMSEAAQAYKSRLRMMRSPQVAINYANTAPTSPNGAFDALKSVGLLPRHTKRIFEDLIEGEVGDQSASVLQCDLKQQTRYVDLLKFRGLLFQISCPKRFFGQTIVARRSWNDGLWEPAKFESVDLPALNDRFQVLTTDQVEARFLLTSDLIDILSGLEATLNGTKLRGVFQDQSFLFAVETTDLFEAGTKDLEDTGFKMYERSVAELRYVRDLVDSFNPKNNKQPK